MPNTEIEAEMAAQPFTDDDLRELVSVALAQKDARFRACAQAIVQMQAERDALRADAARYHEAIRWALGYDDFAPREPGQGAYWWRTELARRAAWDHDAARDAGRARGET